MEQWDIVANWHGLAWGEMGLSAQWDNGTSWKIGMDRHGVRWDSDIVENCHGLAWVEMGKMGLNVMMGELVGGDLTWVETGKWDSTL